MPRLKDLKDQQLYRLDDHGEVGRLFRGAADVGLIREQWDQLVRVASSLRNRTAPAHVVLDRLAASAPADRLAKALTMLGRIVKTIVEQLAAAGQAVAGEHLARVSPLAHAQRVGPTTSSALPGSGGP